MGNRKWWIIAGVVVLLIVVASAGQEEDGGDDAEGGKRVPGGNVEACTANEVFVAGEGCVSEPEPEKPMEKKPSGVDAVATCSDLTGQDPYSSSDPKPGFVACLKRLDAPPDVIAAWGG